MNNKILVEVFVPAAGESFDVFVPLDIKTGNAVKLIASALSDLSKGNYKAGRDATLCDMSTGKILNVDTEVAELGLANGSRLMLI